VTPQEFFARAVPAAVAGGHIFPAYAACEAAEESAWGESGLCRQAKNLFGLKQGKCTEGYPTIALPTTEWVEGRLVPATAHWPCFASWRESFAVRMKVLEALAPEFPHYAAALTAVDGPHFVIEVSKTWSTDPNRARNVLLIHTAHAGLIRNLLEAAEASAAVAVRQPDPPAPPAPPEEAKQ
jgi:flagellum-specific peptidoglycan hydrolase FlgJ